MTTGGGEGMQPQSRENHSRRQVYLVDRDYQLREVNRGVILFMSLIFVQIGLFIGTACLMRAGKLDGISGPTVFVGIAFAVPMIMCIAYSWITVRQTHRVAGAAYRLGQDLRRMASQPSFRFRLRRGDYLQGLVAELNLIMEDREARDRCLAEVERLVAGVSGQIEAMAQLLPTAEAEALRERLVHITARLKALRGCSEKPADAPALASRPSLPEAAPPVSGQGSGGNAQ